MRMGRIRLLLLLMCASLVLWIAFAQLVVPPIIESVYRGESLPLLNSLIKGQHENPISYYRQKWDSLTLHYLLKRSWSASSPPSRWIGFPGIPATGFDHDSSCLSSRLRQRQLM
jgi:hypothetical protein